MSRAVAFSRLATFAAGLVLVLAGALATGPGGWAPPDIFWNLRLPRVLLGAAVGAGLAAAGTVMQGLSGNPLADPFVLGSSSGAAVGVVAARALGISLASPAVFLAAGVGAFGALAATWSLARSSDRLPIERLLLSGVAVSTLGSALVLLGLHFAGQDAYVILSFLVGNLSGCDRRFLAIGGGTILLAVVALCTFGRAMNALALGDEKARTLGVRTERAKASLALLCSGVVGASVAVAGMIGFVGLLVPHLARRIVGPDHRMLLPASAIGGGAFLVTVDTVARTAARPSEFPVGVITALFGAPFFLWVLRRRTPLLA
ncbi:MAG: iron ABC transporter permease [Planctomycetes bacterium]|nr:iron ABC transporter permease [Planctomycetota bacterium]